MHGSTFAALSCGCIGIGLNCLKWMKSTSFVSGKVTWRIQFNSIQFIAFIWAHCHQLQIKLIKVTLQESWW